METLGFLHKAQYMDLNPNCLSFGLNYISFIIRYIHAHIQTIQLPIESDGKHSANVKLKSSPKTGCNPSLEPSLLEGSNEGS